VDISCPFFLKGDFYGERNMSAVSSFVKEEKKERTEAKKKTGNR